MKSIFIFFLLFLFNAQLKAVAVAADITANPQTDSLQKIVYRLSQVLSRQSYHYKRQKNY